MKKYYDEEDVKYYVEEAKNDLEKKGFANFGAGSWRYVPVIRLGDDLYRLRYVYDATPKYHEFIKLNGDVDKVIRHMVIKEGGYHGANEYDYPLFRADAIKLMEMGYIVKHERYHVLFKMVNGVIYDHVKGDEPDHWEEFDLDSYQNGEVFLMDNERIGWTISISGKIEEDD